MASMRDIKRRKGSIQSTQQITKAMKLVSTVKLQKAKTNAENSKSYFVFTKIGHTGIRPNWNDNFQYHFLFFFAYIVSTYDVTIFEFHSIKRVIFVNDLPKKSF